MTFMEQVKGHLQKYDVVYAPLTMAGIIGIAIATGLPNKTQKIDDAILNHYDTKIVMSSANRKSDRTEFFVDENNDGTLDSHVRNMIASPRGVAVWRVPVTEQDQARYTELFAKSKSL